MAVVTEGGLCPICKIALLSVFLCSFSLSEGPNSLCKIKIPDTWAIRLAPRPFPTAQETSFFQGWDFRLCLPHCFKLYLGRVQVVGWVEGDGWDRG